METADKLDKLFLVVPETFLPYPVETLEEAFDIVSIHFFDSGDNKMYELIQNSIWTYFSPYRLSNGKIVTYEEAIEQMKNSLDLMEKS